MKQVVLGPTFEVRVGSGTSDAADRLSQRLAAAGDAVACRRTGTHFLVAVGRPHRHFWSPWLTFELVESEGGEAVGHGRFNPSPAIWTAFMLGGLALLTLAFGGVVWACAEWILDRPLIGLWVTGGSVLGILVLLVVSWIGQGLAREEMAEIETLVRRGVGVDQSEGG